MLKIPKCNIRILFALQIDCPKDLGVGGKKQRLLKLKNYVVEENHLQESIIKHSAIMGT